MEPDFDKIISNKVRQAEQQPVSWNKHAVWHNLQSQTSATRHYFIFYYVAAAIIPLIIYFGAGLNSGENKPQEDDAEVKSGAEATELEAPVLTEENPPKAPVPAVKNREQTTQTTLAAETTDQTVKTVGTEKHETEDEETAIQPVLADIKIQEQEFPLRAEVTAPEQKIRPIVGVIIESDSENVVDAKQKKTLRKLESSSPVPWEDPANVLVFVVRK